MNLPAPGPAPSGGAYPWDEFLPSPAAALSEDNRSLTVGGVVVNDVPDVVLKVYAKGSCRRCYGRGRLNFDTPGGLPRVDACDCVLRQLARERTYLEHRR